MPTPDELNGPPPPLPAHGEPGKHGHGDGTGGDGGAGGRGGIGLPGERGATGPRGPGTRQTSADRWGLALVVTLTAVSAIYFSVSAGQRLDDIEDARSTLTSQQAAFSGQIDCEYGLLEQTLDALKARSVFAEQQAETTLAGDRAQRDFLHGLAAPPPGVPDQQLTRDYLAALGTKIKATEEQLMIRGLNPYPTDDAISACHPPPESSAP